MNDRTPVLVSTAPQPIGPYSQAIKCGNMVFVSGMLALDLQTGQLIPGSAAEQAKIALTYLRSILEAVEVGGFGHVVKTTIFLTDLNDFAEVNKVYGEFFLFEQPARSTVQVAALPRGAKVEIEAIAVMPPQAKEFSGLSH